ncbi:MAG: hypothetical protein HYW57_00465 [Ignavibacteriales bacterium]|nr:hypothetical protein [Ignavibacteriales bacterium]
MKSHRHLGVSFFNGNIQLAEIERGKKMALTNLAEGESSIDFVQAGVHLSAEHPQVATLVAELGSLIRQNKVAAKLVSYALPADPVFINIIPVSTTLKGEPLQQFLYWELRQYYLDAGPKDFIVDAHPLPSTETTVQPNFLVGVRRGMVAFLQRVTRELRLELQIIDVDHLSTEKTLSFNYPEISGHEVALFSVRMSGMIASLVRDGEMIDYRPYRVQIPQDVAKTVTSYLKHLRKKDGASAPDVVFLYGLEVPKDVLEQIRNETETQTVVVNALRKLPVIGKIYQPFTKQNCRFAPAIGLGLRSF